MFRTLTLARKYHFAIAGRTWGVHPPCHFLPDCDRALQQGPVHCLGGSESNGVQFDFISFQSWSSRSCQTKMLPILDKPPQWLSRESAGLLSLPVVRARFEPLRRSLFAPDWDCLRSVAAAALKESWRQLSEADRVRLCGHVKLSSLNPAGYLEFPDRTVEVRTCATSSA